MFSGMHYWKYYRSIVKEILKLSPGSVLDVGCGPGDILAHLALEDGTVKFFGVDPSWGMVNAATGKARKKGLSERITVKKGSSRHVPFDARFDLIFSSMSFHHWKEKEASLRNLSRYLTETGRIMIFDLDRNQFPGMLPVLRRHTLSESACLDLRIGGFSTKVDHMHGTGLILFSIYRQ